MKRILLISFILLFSFTAKSAIITWDGGGDGISWSDANNWIGNILPASTDNVVLDNSLLGGSYSVTLPNTLVTIISITITPNAGNIISLTLPSSNTLQPGLTFNGPGYVLVLNNGGIFKNSTGSANSTPPSISIGVTDSIKINNGGKFIQNSDRAHAYLLDQLSTAPGTERGIFEFDVPSALGYTLSLTNRKYGTLMLTAVAAGGAKTYPGNGMNDLIVRGDLVINTGASLNSTMTANINIAGNLTIAGSFDNTPSVGPSGRSILFNGTSNQIISGLGNFTFGPNFRNIVVNSAATVTLQRGISLSNAANTFIINTSGVLQMGANIINGSGSFQLNSGGWLGIGSAGGITTAPTLSGNVQTGTRTFPSAAVYEYNAAVGVTQITGNGLPATIDGILKINTLAGLGTNGVTLSQSTIVTNEFILTEGKLTTVMPNILYIGSSAITTAAYSDISFVNGIMSKYGSLPYRFPVGKGVTIHPVQLETSGGSPFDLYTVEYFQAGPTCSPGSLTGSIHHTSGLEYWYIQSAASAPSNQITLYASTLSQATDRSRLVITRCNGGTWENLGNANTAPTGAVGDVRSLTALNGIFSNIFTLASLDPSPVNPLPITLITFDASKLSNTQSSINWELAACCSAAAKFEIQRAGADKGFVTIGTVDGSETNKLYNYIDNGLKNGINYYRLKMIDADGQISYSRTVAVMNGVNGLVLTSLFPTIVTNSAALTIASSHQQKLSIVILDMQGKLVQKSNHNVAAGNTTIEMRLAGLAAGVYQLTGITAEGKTNTVRFLKQ